MGKFINILFKKRPLVKKEHTTAVLMIKLVAIKKQVYRCNMFSPHSGTETKFSLI